MEFNKALGSIRLLVPPRYQRRARRQSKRQWRIAIMFFAATEDSPHTLPRFEPSLDSRFVAWMSISMTASMNREALSESVRDCTKRALHDCNV